MAHNIEFISYNGAYPNLCSGELNVKIDGKDYWFGYNHHSTNFAKNVSEPLYTPFWESGGCIDRNEDYSDMWAESGSWELDYNPKDYPQEVVECMEDLIKVFNENVEHGCCGGCL